MKPVMDTAPLDDYTTHRRTRGDWNDASAESITIVLRSWHRHAGPIETWTEAAAHAWIHDPNVRPNTRRGRRGRLRPYTRWLHAHGHLDVDIAADVPKVRIPRPKPRDMSRGEVSSLVAVLPDRRALVIVMLMVQCGLRAGDVSRALIDDVDTDRRLLDVRGKGGRGEVTHTIPIPDEAFDLLAEWISRRIGGPLVPAVRGGGHLTAHHISTMVGRWIRAAGLKAMPHDGRSSHSLRHSAAQHVVDGGASIRTAQHLLGHRSQATTELYVRRAPDGLAEQVNGRRYLEAS